MIENKNISHSAMNWHSRMIISRIWPLPSFASIALHYHESEIIRVKCLESNLLLICKPKGCLQTNYRLLGYCVFPSTPYIHHIYSKPLSYCLMLDRNVTAQIAGPLSGYTLPVTRDSYIRLLFDGICCRHQPYSLFSCTD